MNLLGQSITQVTTITHDGKVLVFGTTAGGAVLYSVKRSGFEDTAVAPEGDPFGFEEWQTLRLGDATPDESVAEDEAQRLTDAVGAPILRSCDRRSLLRAVGRCARVRRAGRRLWRRRRRAHADLVLGFHGRRGGHRGHRRGADDDLVLGFHGGHRRRPLHPCR